MKNYSNYSKNYVEKTYHTTRSSYNYGDKRTNSMERVNNGFTESGIPYGYTAKKVSTVYRIPASNEKREIIVNNKYILRKSNNYDDYENSKTFNTRKNKCRCCRCCNCNCHSCSDNRSSYSALKNRNTRYDTYTTDYSKNLEKTYNYGNTNRSRVYLIEKNPPQVNSYRKVYKKYDVYKYNDKSPSPIKPVNMRYITENNYKKTEENYSYDKKPKKYTNYKEIKGGRIENRYENDISKDGKYVVSMTMSKKVMNQDESKKQKEKEKEKEKGKYRRSYYKEEIEEDNGGREGAFTERKSTIRSRLRDLGDNYRYFERNENKSPLKATITRQKRRQPIHVYGNEYYETNEEVNKYNYYPAKKQNKKITRYYNQEDGEYEKNKNNINDKDYKDKYNKDYEYKYKKDYEYNNNKDYEDNYNNDYEDDNNKDYNDTNNNRYFVEKKYEKYEEKNNDNYEDNNNKDYEDNYNKDYEDDNKDYNDNNNRYYVEKKYEKYEENNNDNYEDNNIDNYEDNNNDNYEENKEYEYHEEHYRENDDGNYEENNFDEGNNNYEENNDGNYDDNNNENYEKVEKYEYTNYYGY